MQASLQTTAGGVYRARAGGTGGSKLAGSLYRTSDADYECKLQRDPQEPSSLPSEGAKAVRTASEPFSSLKPVPVPSQGSHTGFGAVTAAETSIGSCRGLSAASTQISLQQNGLDVRHNCAGRHFIRGSRIAEAGGRYQVRPLSVALLGWPVKQRRAAACTHGSGRSVMGSHGARNRGRPYFAAPSQQRRLAASRRSER